MAKKATVKLDTLDFKESDVTNAKIVATGNDQLQFVGSSTEHIYVTGAKIGRNQSVVNTATHTILKDELVTLVTYSSTGVCTLTLPSTSDAGTHFFHIVDEGRNSSVNNITIETPGAGTINGEDDTDIAVDGMSLTLVCDGTNWRAL